MNHPFLNFLEVALVRFLSRSPRIGLILVKEHGTNISWVVRDRSDPQPMGVEETAYAPRDVEPPSMALERMFHAPDADR